MLAIYILEAKTRIGDICELGTEHKVCRWVCSTNSTMVTTKTNYYMMPKYSIVDVVSSNSGLSRIVLYFHISVKEPSQDIKPFHFIIFFSSHLIS